MPPGLLKARAGHDINARLRPRSNHTSQWFSDHQPSAMIRNRPLNLPAWTMHSLLHPSPPHLVYDAAIIGFGPIGATAANLLARRGLRVAVVAAEFEVYNKPRALTFDHEAMRIFQA